MVLRSFPIRVGGNSGPIKFEIDWKTVKSISGKDNDVKEYTTVTNRLRRVARFNPQLVNEAIHVNSPTTIVLNHLDYVDNNCQKELTKKGKDFIRSVENNINRKIDYVGISPKCLVQINEIYKKDRLQDESRQIEKIF